MNVKFDELVAILLRNVGPVLYDIYQAYFINEIRSKQGEDEMRKINEKVIFEFYRDYDICPTLITKGNAYKIYLHVYENEVPTYTSIGMDIVSNST